MGIGESAVSSRPADLIVTHALGSCVAVCIWDPVARVGGLLHFLLPSSSINPVRALRRPDAFADTGLPRLFQTAYTRGLKKHRAIVRLAGGAETSPDPSGLATGARNLAVARDLLRSNGVRIHGEAVGGRQVRTVTLAVGTGQLTISCGRQLIAEL